MSYQIRRHRSGVNRLGMRMSRRGMTLTELLLVILILSLLVAAGLPLMKTNMQERKLREGSRMLNALFASAKSDAAALGRPVGVWLDREPGSAFESSRMSIAETPPLFMGAFDNSQARIGRSTL
ncbi:MAG: prepilin-type N-terminal cleavage/methylation domain-containing protein, partial [Pirellulaceae bacterium]